MGNELVLRSYVAVQEAYRIVRSPQVSNDDKQVLAKLRKRFEKEVIDRTRIAARNVWRNVEQKYIEHALARADSQEA